MPEFFFQAIVSMNENLSFQFQAPANPFDRFSKGFLRPSISVIRTFIAISVKVAIFMSTPFAPNHPFGQTEYSKI